MLHAFLNVSKPRGITSHDVVARVRRLTGQQRVGHTGTLDPLAEGVLPIALGRATRLADLVGQADKSYYAVVKLGEETTTDDAEGQVMQRTEVPAVDQRRIEEVVRHYRGDIDQVPPAFSALKVGGRRAYRAARRGEAIHLEPRRVSIHELRVLACDQHLLELYVRCSKGTYIRSLARDIGRDLAVGGHLASLVRTSVGLFRLADAWGLDDLAGPEGSQGWRHALIEPDLTLLAMKAIIAGERGQLDFRHGRSWPAEPRPALSERGEASPSSSGTGEMPGVRGLADAELVRAYTRTGQFLGLMDYDAGGRCWRPRLALSD